jgi:hypothetical protein
MEGAFRENGSNGCSPGLPPPLDGRGSPSKKSPERMKVKSDNNRISAEQGFFVFFR